MTIGQNDKISPVGPPRLVVGRRTGDETLLPCFAIAFIHSDGSETCLRVFHFEDEFAAAVSDLKRGIGLSHVVNAKYSGVQQ